MKMPDWAEGLPAVNEQWGSGFASGSASHSRYQGRRRGRQRGQASGQPVQELLSGSRFALLAEPEKSVGVQAAVAEAVQLELELDPAVRVAVLAELPGSVGVQAADAEANTAAVAAPVAGPLEPQVPPEASLQLVPLVTVDAEAVELLRQRWALVCQDFHSRQLAIAPPSNVLKRSARHTSCG